MTSCDICKAHIRLATTVAEGGHEHAIALNRSFDNIMKHIRSGKCKDVNYPKKEYVISPSYIVTFTTDPQKRYRNDLELFQREVEGQLKRKNIAEAMYSIEHIKSNMHAHCFIKCLGRALNNPLTDWKFMHNKVGMVQVEPVGRNNGVEQYLQKENPIFERRGDWPNFSFHQRDE